MIVLDTHIWLWWVNLEHHRLPADYRDMLIAPEPVGVSPASCFEVAWLVRRGRISLPATCGDWFVKALGGSGVECLPLTAEIARRAADLPEHHRDPMDRFIIATAVQHQAKLMSLDRQFAQYPELNGLLLN